MFKATVSSRSHRSDLHSRKELLRNAESERIECPQESVQKKLRLRWESNLDLLNILCLISLLGSNISEWTICSSLTLRNGIQTPSPAKKSGWLLQAFSPDCRCLTCFLTFETGVVRGECAKKNLWLRVWFKHRCTDRHSSIFLWLGASWKFCSLKSSSFGLSLSPRAHDSDVLCHHIGTPFIRWGAFGGQCLRNLPGLILNVTLPWKFPGMELPQ